MADRAFPGVTVERVNTEKFVTGGEDEGPVLENVADELTPDMLKEFFEGETTLIYTLRVKAASRAGARARAKLFVRSKNLFEPQRLNEIHTGKVEQDGVAGVYEVTVGVMK